VLHSALALGQQVEVQGRFEDTGAWTSLGTSNTLGSTSATFTLPLGSAGKRWAVRVILSGLGSNSPQLGDLVVRYQLATDPMREWTFAVILEGTAELPLVTLDGTAESKSGETVSADLWALKGQAGPLTFVDLDGASRAAWFVGYEERLAEESQRRGRQLRGVVMLVEA